MNDWIIIAGAISAALSAIGLMIAAKSCHEIEKCQRRKGRVDDC